MTSHNPNSNVDWRDDNYVGSIHDRLDNNRSSTIKNAIVGEAYYNFERHPHIERP